MKLLFVIQCTNLGGMEQSAVLLMSELKRMGHQCELISLNPVGDLGPILSRHGIPVRGVEYRGKGGWRSFFPLRSLLKHVTADGMVMIGHNLMAMIAIGRQWRKHRLLSIHYHHEGVKTRQTWRLIYRVAVAQFRNIVFPSQFILNEALRIAPFLRQHARLITYPIAIPILPSTEQREAARERLGIPNNVKVVGNAGWLIQRKRWDIFIRVASQVTASFPDTLFLIAGDGPERDSLERLSKSMGVANSIRWLGWQKDLADFYSSLDVMLFNSDWDAIGRTPLDGMAFGIPTVASVLHGGLAEVITDSTCGVLHDTHDVHRMATDVIRFLSDSGYAAEIGMRGRQRLVEYGSPELHAKKTLAALGFPQHNSSLTDSLENVSR